MISSNKDSYNNIEENINNLNLDSSNNKNKQSIN